MRQPILLLPLLASLAMPAGAAAPLDITRPILARDGARGCTSSADLTRLLASASDSVPAGCFAVEPGTRGYFMDELGSPPDRILLDIKVDFRMRLLWLPATALRNP